MKALSRNMLVFLVQRTWQYAGGLRPRLMLVYGLLLLANIVTSFQPVVLARIIDAAQKGGPTALHDALLWSGIYAGVTFTFWILHGPARVFEQRIGFAVYRNFVASLYRQITQLPLRWHQDHHSGSTINRINKAGRALFSFARGQFVIIQTIVRFAVSLSVLVWFSWWVALVSILSSMIIMLTVRKFDKIIVPLVLRHNEREHHLNSALYDYIGNIVTVLTLRLQRNTVAEIEERFDAMKPPFARETLVNEYKWGSVNLMLIVTQAGIVGSYIAAHMWNGEAIALGPVVAIFQYLLLINQLFFQGMMSYETLMYQQLDVHGVDDLIEDHAQLATARLSDRRAAWRDIRIDDLVFMHREGEDILHTLQNVDLAIHAGQKIALIGQSGSGKTTLLTLMRGLYEAQTVRLTIDDKIHNSLAPLAAFTTLVPQDSEIFENTIEYNLTLGTDMPEGTVNEALTITTFGEVVAKLPHGVDTDIRERGVNLSGGQKQRLALTRGIIAARDSSLLLLDEPTSSVDLPTEAIIFDRLFASFADKTVIASIHRLHLLPRFDHIVVMQGGMLLEQGSFPDLIARRGEFYRQWQHHLVQSSTNEDDSDNQ